jgi:hypothetical protein
LAERVVNYLKTTQDSILFLSFEQGGPVTNSPMLKAAGNAELLPAKKQEKENWSLHFYL